MLNEDRSRPLNAGTRRGFSQPEFNRLAETSLSRPSFPARRWFRAGAIGQQTGHFWSGARRRGWSPYSLSASDPRRGYRRRCSALRKCRGNYWPLRGNPGGTPLPRNSVRT